MFAAEVEGKPGEIDGGGKGDERVKVEPSEDPRPKRVS